MHSVAYFAFLVSALNAVVTVASARAGKSRDALGHLAAATGLLALGVVFLTT